MDIFFKDVGNAFLGFGWGIFKIDYKRVENAA